MLNSKKSTNSVRIWKGPTKKQKDIIANEKLHMKILVFIILYAVLLINATKRLLVLASKYIVSFVRYIIEECSYYLRKNYVVKGTAFLLAVVSVLAIIFLVGFKTAETTKKDMSIANQVEYEYYVVEANDGWDVIANAYKPDFMGIRGNFVDGDKYNYSHYLHEANPEIGMLHPGDVIKCPIFSNIYDN